MTGHPPLRPTGGLARPVTREWFSAADLAALHLPAMPHTTRGVQLWAEARGLGTPDREGRDWRRREGRGGGVEYHLGALPSPTQAVLAVRFAALPEVVAPASARTDFDAAERWAWFERQPETRKTKARSRMEALLAVAALVTGGIGRVQAMQMIAANHGVALSSLYAWDALVRGLDRDDWLPALAPRHVGSSGREAACEDAAWDLLRADWLRPEGPDFEACHRRLAAKAAAEGWTLPSKRTLHRRLLALPEAVRVLAREGEAKVRALYPPQERDRSGFHALEAVNTDGHQFDVFVRWPDGSVGRPVMLAFQDLLSGKVLSWRVDRSENRDAFRLAFGDLVERWGIPDHVWVDNTRAAANKWMTGGTLHRFRFKVREEEPLGIFPLLGVEVHFTKPYSGQSKPIERAFRDFARDLAKHPAFSGAYTGNKPDAKPENYRSKAVPLAEFLRVLEDGIAEHNARPERRGVTAKGKSFDATFEASYRDAPVRKASPAQRRLWLLAAEAVRVRTDGSVHLLGNRYWAEELLEHRGRPVAVRFDPEHLHQPLHVYRLDGAYVGAAACQEAAGFNDTAAARAHGQARQQFIKGIRMQLDAERRMDAAELAAALPETDPPPPPETRIVKPLFRGNAALAPAPRDDEAPDRFMAAARVGLTRPRLVHDEDPATGG